MHFLKEIFEIREKNLINLFNVRIKHNPSDGKYREDVVKTIIDLIPQKYKSTNGFVIDSEGNVSKEMDLIIFDDLYVPKFFMETYGVIPIESVLAVIQVKTRLDNSKLSDSIDNLNSINCLKPKRNGSIISANHSNPIIEERIIYPLKILVSGTSDTNITAQKIKDIDFYYSISNNGKDKLLVKQMVHKDIVSREKDFIDLYNQRSEIDNYNEYNENKLYLFYYSLLKYLTYINNSLIINYDEYIKGVLENE